MYTLVKYNKDLGEWEGAITNFKRAFEFQSKESVAEWFSDTKTINDIKNGGQAISELAEQYHVTEESAITFAQKLRDQEVVLAEGETALEGYTAWMKSTGQASSFAAAKTTLFTVAAKALSTIGWTVFLTLAISLFTKLASSIEHAWNKAKYMVEAAEEAKKTIKDLNDTMKDHKSLVEEVGDRYAYLLKGVNTADLSNNSLSTDEYQEFLDINKRLAEAFPQLKLTLNENGDAILNLGRNGESAAAQLEKTLKAEEDLNNFKISQNIDDVFGGASVAIDEYIESTDRAANKMAAMQENLTNLQTMANGGMEVGDSIEFTTSADDEIGMDRLNAIVKGIQTYRDSLDIVEKIAIGDILDDNNLYTVSDDGTYNLYVNTFCLDEKQKAALANAIKTQAEEIVNDATDVMGDANSELEQSKVKAENAWTDFLPSLVASMHSQQTYKNLDETTQKIADTIVGNLSMDQSDLIKNSSSVDEYIRDYIIGPLQNMSAEDKAAIQDAYQKLFSLDVDNMNPEELKAQVEKYVKTISDLLGLDSNELKIKLGFDGLDDTVQNYKVSLEATKDKFSNNIKEAEAAKDDYFDWDQWYQENIKTQQDIDNWEQIRKSCQDAAEARRQFMFSQTQPDSGFTSILSQIQKLSEGFDQIDAIYADVFDKEDFDWSSILNNESFATTFGNMTDVTDEYKKAYEDFIRTVSNSPSDLNACQGAFDNLATAYLYNSDALKSVTEETKQATINQLEQMGVSNAEEIVTAALTEKYAELAYQKWVAENASYDFASATVDDINSISLEGGYADTTRQKIALYTLQKQLSNQTTIYTGDDIENLKAIALAAGAGGAAIATMGEALEAMEHNKDNSFFTDDPSRITRRYNAIYAQLAASIENTTKATVKYVGGTKSAAAAQKAAKDATKDATDAIKKQKEALEKQKSALEETKKELELLYDAIVWFYDNQSDKIDKQIDKLNDANDALNDQKDTYDAILAAIDKVYQAQIDAIQERIDALDKANDEEEKALELEKARQTLEEARRKKNIKVYTKDKGFVYTVDESAIKDAEDDYNNLVDEMQKDEIKKALEDQIEALNKLRDTFADIPKAWEEAMNKLKASEMFGSNWEIDILNPSDDLINNFRNQYTGTQDQIQNNENKISALEKEKERIEELKQLWEDAKNAYTYQQYEMKLNSFFGSDYEHQLLNNSASWRAKFAADYGDICAQIEALEKQIAALDEETADASASAADKTSEAMGKTAGAIKGASDAAQNAKIGQYIWTDADDYALTSADSRLKELNRLIGDDTSSALIGTRDDIEQFVNSFEHLKTSGEITNSLKDSMNALLSSSDESLYGLQRVLGGVKDRITESEKATQSVKDSSQAAGESIDSLGQKVQTLNGASGAIESEADKAVANTDAALQSALGKIDELKTAMAELNTARTNLQGAVDLAVIDTNRVIVTSNNIVTSLSTEINGLISGLNLLSAALNTLVTRITSLNGLQLTQIVGQFTSSGLLGAITSVVSSLTGANGLIPILQVTLNGTKLTEVIGQFNGEEGLLAAVNSVSTAIFSGDDECLFNRIMNLSTTISTIDTVSEAFRRTCDHINEAKKAVDKLIETINKIPTKKETHHYIYTHRIDARATGTAFTDSHYAAGTANKSGASYAKGSGNWGLTEDQPHSLVAELGPEILVRDSQYFVIPKPQFMDLKKGDIVFNHEQTKAILNGGKASMIEKLDNKANKVVPGILEKKGSSFANGTSPELDVNSLKQKVDNSTFVRSANFGVPMSNQNVGNTTTLQFNGNLSFPNIKSGNDAEKLIRELQNLPNRALQKANKR